MKERKKIKCKVCGYIWYPYNGEEPLRCANLKCRTFHYNRGNKKGVKNGNESNT